MRNDGAIAEHSLSVCACDYCGPDEPDQGATYTSFLDEGGVLLECEIA